MATTSNMQTTVPEYMRTTATPPPPTAGSAPVQNYRQLSNTNQVGTQVGAPLPQFNQMQRTTTQTGAVGAAVGAPAQAGSISIPRTISKTNGIGVAVDAPSQANNLNVQREISATNAIQDRTGQWLDTGANISAPMQYQFAEDRLTNMVGTNSRFMNEARRQGLEQAAARGAGNSSIAAGAAMREAIRAAAPIAQQDAGFTQTEYGRGMGAKYQGELATQANNARLREMNMQTQLQDDAAANALIRGMDEKLFSTRAQNALSQNDLMREIARLNASSNLEDQLAGNALIRQLDSSEFQFRGQNALSQNDLMREIARLNASGTIEDQQRANELLRSMDSDQFRSGLQNQMANADVMREVERLSASGRVEDQLAANALLRQIDSSLVGADIEQQLRDSALNRDLIQTRYGADVEQQLRDSDINRTMTRDAFLARLGEQAADNATDRTAYLNELDYQFRNQLADNDTFRQNWLNQESSFRGMMEQAYSTELGLNAGMLERLSSAFIDDPEVYNPEVISGMLNFFRMNASSIINQNLANILGDRLGTTPRSPGLPSGTRVEDLGPRNPEPPVI